MKETNLSSNLLLETHSGQESINFPVTNLVIGGFTARDDKTNQAHIRELEAQGIEPPASLPVFLDVRPSLLTQDTAIRTDRRETSGEVEPVLFISASSIYLGVGSDHTDRIRERDSLISGKEACSKTVGTRVLELEAAEQQWDGLRIKSWVDGVAYQSAALSEMMTPSQILSAYEVHIGGKAKAGTVLFLGTAPLLGGEFVYGDSFRVELVGSGLELVHEYTVGTLGD